MVTVAYGLMVVVPVVLLVVASSTTIARALRRGGEEHAVALPAALATSPLDGTQSCPACGQPIQAAARVCKHCRHRTAAAPSPASQWLGA